MSLKLTAAPPHAGPVGVFDSGWGGLSVLHAIRAALPAEHLLYCADHAYLPYGERSAGAIRTRALVLGRALVAHGCKAIVMACNTATAAAADALRTHLAVPVIAMEPAVKPAAAATCTGVVGVLGTGGTLASARFAGLLARYADAQRVVTRPCPELVAAVEQGDGEEGAVRAQVATALQPLLEAGADAVVLGCTHFAFLRREIEDIAGPDVQVIDTGAAVADELLRRLEETGMRRAADTPGRVTCWTTAAPAAHQGALQRLWGSATLVAAPAMEPCRPATDRSVSDE